MNILTFHATDKVSFGEGDVSYRIEMNGSKS